MILHYVKVWNITLVLAISLSAGLVLAASTKEPIFEEIYPDLAVGILKTASLGNLEPGVILTAGEVKVSDTALKEAVKNSNAELRDQLQKNLLFLLEQFTMKKILFYEAYKAGHTENEPEDQIILKYLNGKVAGVIVSDEEVQSFYVQNKDFVGGAPFEQVKDSLKMYLLQVEQQKVIIEHVQTLGQRNHIRLDAQWVKAQSILARDNPVDRARSSKTPTLVEFGATGCKPCDMMQPILDNLRKKYKDKLTIIFVHVGKEQILGARYGIEAIPVQVFFDSAGREIFRHTGFYPEAEIEKKLASMGVK